jgi:hypothetical protein
MPGVELTMLENCSKASIAHQQNRRRLRPCLMNPHKIQCVLSTAVLAVSFLCPTRALACDGSDEPPRSEGTLEPARAASQSAFLAKIHQTLKTQHDRLIEIANRRMGAGADPQRSASQRVDERTRRNAAGAAYRDAKLAREIAEINVAEYNLGTSVQEELTAKGEVTLAEDEVRGTRMRSNRLKDQLGRIQRASTGSAMDLRIEFERTDRVMNSQCQARKALREAETARSRLRMLVTYTKPIRLRELQAKVELARSVELAKRAIVEMETASRAQVGDAAGENGSQREIGLAGARGRIPDPPPPSVEARIMALLDYAISVEEQLRLRLSQVKKEGKAESRVRDEIRDLASHLEVVVDDVEAQLPALEVIRLRARIHRAVRKAAVPAK